MLSTRSPTRKEDSGTRTVVWDDDRRVTIESAAKHWTGLLLPLSVGVVVVLPPSEPPSTGWFVPPSMLLSAASGPPPLSRLPSGFVVTPVVLLPPLPLVPSQQNFAPQVEAVPHVVPVRQQPD
jgi:hypothetical protein